MKMVKSLILGSAAGLVAMSGAQAADLPVKAKAVEYVRICSLYGAGFYYIPGTDTCIKLAVTCAPTPPSTVATTVSRPGAAISASRTASRLLHQPFPYGADVDTRTATEYGVVRTFGLANFNFHTTAPTTRPPSPDSPGLELDRSVRAGRRLRQR